MVDIQSNKFPLNIVLKLQKFGAIKFYGKNYGADNDGVSKKDNPRRHLLLQTLEELK